MEFLQALRLIDSSIVYPTSCNEFTTGLVRTFEEASTGHNKTLMLQSFVTDGPTRFGNSEAIDFWGTNPKYMQCIVGAFLCPKILQKRNPSAQIPVGKYKNTSLGMESKPVLFHVAGRK